MREVFHEAINELGKGDRVVIATVVRTKGSTPQKPGAKLLVRNDGSGVGTLGGGCVEGDIWFAAQELMKRGGPAQYRDYQLNEELAAEDGLVCGGTMYFLIDPVYSPGAVPGGTVTVIQYCPPCPGLESERSVLFSKYFGAYTNRFAVGPRHAISAARSVTKRAP